MVRAIQFAYLALAASAVGCLSLSLSDHTVRCHANAPACPEGYFCGSDGYCYANGHTPPTPDMIVATKMAADPCTFAGECVTGYCVDGVCCATDCSDSCNACNVPGSEGKCSPIPNGQTPAANHAACGPDPTSSCGRDGTCDGMGFCRKYDIQAVCKPSSCNLAGNLFVAESTCDGKGNCISPPSITCEPFACKPDMTACYPSCTPTGNECSKGNVCTNGSCGLKVDGSTCAADGECKSGKCIDHVCCKTGCDGQCQACDLTMSRGTCATVPSGQPHSSHQACNTSNATCAGSCAGDPMACAYPDPSTVCQAQSCTGAVVTYAKKCDGGGNCVAPNPETLMCQAPTNGSATCNGASCGISCDKYYGPDASGTKCVPVWTSESPTTFFGTGLSAVWGSAPNNIYAVSSRTVFHSAGDGNWTAVYTVPGNLWSFSTIWGDTQFPQHVFAVGSNAVFHTSDGGKNWANETTADMYTLRLAAGSSYNDMLAVGGQVFSNYSSGWHEITQQTKRQYGCMAFWGGQYFASTYGGDIYQTIFRDFSIKRYSTGWNTNGIYGFGSGTNGQFYMVGAGGHIAYGQLDPNQWGTPAQNSNTMNDLYSVYGAGTGFYAVGANGTILYSTGDGNWTPQVSNTTARLTGVWASGPNDIYAVGADSSNNGVVMHLK